MSELNEQEVFNYIQERNRQRQGAAVLAGLLAIAAAVIAAPFWAVLLVIAAMVLAVGWSA